MAGGFIYGYVVMLSLVVVVMLSALGKGSGKLSVVPAARYDFRDQVDRIVVDDLTGDVYVAGDNVLYHLNSELTLLQMNILDPNKPCRCNNSVKVLEIEPKFRGLLVCASSEKGECVIKDLKNITTNRTFNKEQSEQHGFVGYRIVVDDSEVPFVHFDQQFSTAISNTSRLVVVSPNTISANDKNSRSKPLLSVREIYNEGETLYMRYVTTKEGQLQMNKFNIRFQYYVIDKFCFNGTCYFITLQQANQSSDVLVNRLATVCTRSLYPYVEQPLVFKKNNNEKGDKSRVLAATVGKVGDGPLGEIPLVVIVFGVASNSSARHADVTLGYSITVITLEELENFVAVAMFQCDLGGLDYPDWIDGTPNKCVEASNQQQAKCNRTDKITVRQVHYEPLAVTTFIPGDNDTGTVVSVFTHTRVVDDNGTQRLDETMIIYVLLSSGRFHIFRCSKSHDAPFKTTYLGPALMYSETPADSLTWQVKADIAITDEFFYFLSSTKVVKVPLDYCINIATCEDCLQTTGCFWCQSNATCGLRSKNCFNEMCPARIANFWPTSGPTKGGTVLSLNFTESLSDNKTIEVCGQPCSEIRNESSLSCTVPSSKNDSEAVCNIVVTLWSNPPTRISATGYRYIIPRFQGFEPPRMIMSERGQMRLHGQDLDTGSRVAVILSPDKDIINGDNLTCNVLERNKTSILCELNTTSAHSGNNKRVYCYGITLTIDNARLEQRSGESFCRHPDPELTQVYPMFTFASGGTQVTLEGTDLNTTGPPHLALSLPVNETGKYQEEISQHPCQPCPEAWNKTCVLCCLPVFPSPTSTNESLQMWFSFREDRVGLTLAPVVFNGSTPLTLSVLPDPQFIIADLQNQKNQKCLPMGEQVTPLTVMSRGIPVNTTLTIHVGGQMCSTTEKSSSTWTCNFPSLAPVLKSGATCEDSSSQRTVSTADQSVCGENICGKINMESGIYEVHVITEYRRFYVGCVNLTQMSNRKDNHLSLLLMVGGGALGGVLLLIIVVMCCVMYVKYQKRKFKETFRAQHSLTSSNFISSPVGSAENTYLSLVHLLNPQQDKKKEKDIYHSNLLIQRKNLTLGKVIGNGNFGCVLEGELHGKDHEEPLRVAVKTLLDPVTHAIDLQGFIDEALLMKNFNHEHLGS
ncbi:hepatocyte growth factor receptor-like isoform X2 [Pomacea canaliculata]|uniref:hepatocyte growth factor receptor-like isoform X2 n=1 Tax=Pomacea canaliculata TaxID=400727 RepID=UPI000D728160|nr:hepatocyte growth factor receptor-like isoform X2 [Pomacea canaliculata]